VASQLIEEVTTHAQSEDTREICADGTYFPHNLRKNVLKLSRPQNTIKCSRSDSRVKVCKFSKVSGTDCVPIFRVLLMTGKTKTDELVP